MCICTAFFTAVMFFFSRSEILSNHIYLYAPQCLLLSYFLYILMHRSIYCCYIFRIGNSFHFLFQAVCICDNLQKQVEDSIKNDQRDPLTIKGIKYKFNYCTGFHLARFIVNDFLDEEWVLETYCPMMSSKVITHFCLYLFLQNLHPVYFWEKAQWGHHVPRTVKRIATRNGILYL